MILCTHLSPTVLHSVFILVTLPPYRLYWLLTTKFCMVEKVRLMVLWAGSCRVLAIKLPYMLFDGDADCPYCSVACLFRDTGLIVGGRGHPGLP